MPCIGSLQGWGLMHRPVSAPLGAPADRWPSSGRSAFRFRTWWHRWIGPCTALPPVFTSPNDRLGLVRLAALLSAQVQLDPSELNRGRLQTFLCN